MRPSPPSASCAPGSRPSPCVVLDAPAAVRRALDVWDERDPGGSRSPGSVKERFDPQRTMRPGVFVGGI